MYENGFNGVPIKGNHEGLQTKGRDMGLPLRENICKKYVIIQKSIKE